MSPEGSMVRINEGCFTPTFTDAVKLGFFHLPTTFYDELPNKHPSVPSFLLPICSFKIDAQWGLFENILGWDFQHVWRFFTPNGEVHPIWGAKTPWKSVWQFRENSSPGICWLHFFFQFHVLFQKSFLTGWIKVVQPPTSRCLCCANTLPWD